MPRGRQLPPLVLTDEQHEHLTALSRSTSMPHAFQPDTVEAIYFSISSFRIFR